jgi:hypothetical protein
MRRGSCQRRNPLLLSLLGPTHLFPPQRQGSPGSSRSRAEATSACLRLSGPMTPLLSLTPCLSNSGGLSFPTVPISRLCTPHVPNELALAGVLTAPSPHRPSVQEPLGPTTASCL